MEEGETPKEKVRNRVHCVRPRVSSENNAGNDEANP